LTIESRNYLLAGASALLFYWWIAGSGRSRMRDLRLDRVLSARTGKMTGSVGRRCAMGCQPWPAEDDYAICPRCGEPTNLYRGLTPIPKRDALSLKRKAEFEHYYTHEHVMDADPLTDAENEALDLN
jgi:hypothetical protein